jgi:hypothetical protein
VPDSIAQIDPLDAEDFWRNCEDLYLYLKDDKHHDENVTLIDAALFCWEYIEAIKRKTTSVIF